MESAIIPEFELGILSEYNFRIYAIFHNGTCNWQIGNYIVTECIRCGKSIPKELLFQRDLLNG